jgi:hypothetical protein
MLIKNQTCVEIKEIEYSYGGETIAKNVYNVGWENNIINVMGPLWKCLLPQSFDIKIAGDGYSFPHNDKYRKL